ncbi:MAG: hypothetical protein ABIY90_18310 [Puia sp.]
MNEEQSFFISVLNLIPVGSFLFIQAPSLEVESILNVMKETENEYFKSIELTPENKRLLINEIKLGNFQNYIHLTEIRHNKQLLFQGFDGVEFGIISNRISLPKEFILKYINDNFCSISKDW